tara:strand:- start:1756 stop:2625 length:870 start_codon:yes stop_codon:yes gene_type:complete
MTATPQGTPQLTIPEGQEGIASPDQQELVEQIQQEGQISEEAQQVLEKFKSTEDLAKSYAELQRKFTQNQQQKPETQTEQTEPQVESYTAEQAAQVYGKETVEALAEKGMNLGEVMYKADSGGDISEHYDTLAEAFNVPRQVVENYVSGAKATQPSEPQGLSEEQEQQIKDELGGDTAFNQIADWAGKNLNAETLKSYNETIDSGNADAIRWAVRSLQIEMANPNAVVEPKLIGGGDVPSQTTFTSQQQVLDALSKTNDKGQKIYDLDGTYRDSVKEMLKRSPAWDSLK